MIDEKTQIKNFFNKNEIVTYKNFINLNKKLLKYKNDNY